MCSLNYNAVHLTPRKNVQNKKKLLLFLFLLPKCIISLVNLAAFSAKKELLEKYFGNRILELSRSFIKRYVYRLIK